jgi:eukaryotic-like serine/threonine-protein kinase
MNNLSLRTKLFLGFLIVVLVSLLTAALVTSIRGRQVANQSAQQSLERGSMAFHAFEDSLFNQLELIVVTLARDPNLVGYFEQASTGDLGFGDAGGDTTSILDQLKEKQQFMGFDLAIALDTSGKVTARTDSVEAVEEDLSTAPIVKTVLERNEPLTGYWRDRDALYEASITPMADPAGNVVAYMLAGFQVKAETLTKAKEAANTDFVFFIPTDSGSKVAVSTLSTELTRAAEQAVSKLPSFQALMKEGTETASLDLELNGQKYIGRFEALTDGLGSRQGGSLALTAVDPILAPFRAIQRAVLLGGLLATALAGLIAWQLGRGVVRPLQSLAEAADAASHGDYSKSLSVQTNDEVGQLSKSLQTLLSELNEKKEMEGYVYDISRYLPDPAQQNVGTRSTATRGTIGGGPARRESQLLLALENRTAMNGAPAQVLSELGMALSAVDRLVERAGGQVRAMAGGRMLISFPASKLDRALALLGSAEAVLASTHIGEEKVAWQAALAEGETLTGTLDLQSMRSNVVAGPVVQAVFRLLEEGGTGIVLFNPQLKDRLLQLLPEAQLAVATGAQSGKKFLATRLAGLPQLEAAAEEVARDATRPLTAQSVAQQQLLSRLPVPGETFAGRYEINAILGSGGMGVVYKARDIELDDFVAMKMLRFGDSQDRTQLEAMKSEIKVARKITHPNVVRTFDFGEADGMPFITMEYVRGMTLRYLLKQRGRLPFSAAQRIAKQLCAGLQAAHDEGVLHRDIKPENLILDPAGNAKLMDFGIALSPRLTTQNTGSFVGTPQYASPEQLLGQPADARTDIYSTGVLLCEIFCGQLPITGENTMELYMAHVQVAPIKPSELWPEIPAKLEKVILKCLNKRPEDRFASAGELADALSDIR